MAHALGALPCVSIHLREGGGTDATPLSRHFDLSVGQDQLPSILDTLRLAPLASQALVQLLRMQQRLDVGSGLVAESLVYSTLQSGPEFQRWLRERRAPREWAAPLRPAVRVEREGARLLVTLDRPEKHNAFSVEMRDGIAEALRVVIADASIERVELRGQGPSFSSGGDLDEFGTLPDPATAHAIRSARHPARLLAACAGRVRVFLHGACVGAGIELPAFAHDVRARRDAFFLLPEVRFGLVPGAGGTVSLPRRIGRQRTAWLALSGERLDAETAFAWGLVDGLES
jgi:hypothetical protein